MHKDLLKTNEKKINNQIENGQKTWTDILQRKNPNE